MRGGGVAGIYGSNLHSSTLHPSAAYQRILRFIFTLIGVCTLTIQFSKSSKLADTLAATLLELLRAYLTHQRTKFQVSLITFTLLTNPQSKSKSDLGFSLVTHFPTHPPPTHPPGESRESAVRASYRKQKLLVYVSKGP